MKLIAELLAKKAVPKADIESSIDTLDKLLEQRANKIRKQLESLSGSEDLNLEIPHHRAPIRAAEESVYTPPLQNVVPPDYTQAQTYSSPGTTAAAIEQGINNLFDDLASEASQYNVNIKSDEKKIGIRRPFYSGEMRPPADGGPPVLVAWIHTSNWGIFLFGYADTVKMYLLPYDESHVVKLADLEKESCTPLLEATTQMGAGARLWFINGKLVAPSLRPQLAHDLLQDLIVASNQTS